MSSYASGQSSFGTLLKIGDAGSPENYTTVLNVGDITGPSTKMASAKTTSHSTSIPWDSFIPTIIDGGTVAFPVFAKTDSASWEALIDIYVNRDQRDMILVMTDTPGTTLHFVAHIETLNMKHPVAGVLTADLTLKITGKIDFGF